MKSIAEMSGEEIAAWYHGKDREALSQAVLVAGKQTVDLDEIKQWSKAEGATDKFAEFLALL